MLARKVVVSFSETFPEGPRHVTQAFKFEKGIREIRVAMDLSCVGVKTDEGLLVFPFTKVEYIELEK